MANSELRGHAVGMKTPPIVGPVVRVAVALLLCSACFQAGRWYQELSAPSHVDTGNELVSATFRGAPEPAPQTIEPTPLASSGDPVGEKSDIITPLNVRDPSALIMGPGSSWGPPSAVVPEPEAPSALEARPRALKPIKPLKSGRLLELLKKGEEDKKAPSPKSF